MACTNGEVGAGNYLRTGCERSWVGKEGMDAFQ